MKWYWIDWKNNLELVEQEPLTKPRIARTMMDIAHRMALLSKCPQGKRHSCVIARLGKYIISTGYNGPAVGHSHCIEFAKDHDPNAWCHYSPSTNACPAIHAEENAIINAAREGIKIDGCYAYITKEPCKRCKGILVNAGIGIIAVEEKHGQRVEGKTVGDNEQDTEQKHINRKTGWGFIGDK